MHDWTAFKKWMVDNEWTALSRNQANATPVAELDQAIIDGQVSLPPDIEEIAPYNKLTIAKGK